MYSAALSSLSSPLKDISGRADLLHPRPPRVGAAGAGSRPCWLYDHQDGEDLDRATRQHGHNYAHDPAGLKVPHSAVQSYPRDGFIIVVKAAASSFADHLNPLCKALGFTTQELHRNVRGKACYATMRAGEGKEKGTDFKPQLPAPPTGKDWVRLGGDGKDSFFAFVDRHNKVEKWLPSLSAESDGLFELNQRICTLLDKVPPPRDWLEAQTTPLNIPEQLLRLGQFPFKVSFKPSSGQIQHRRLFHQHDCAIPPWLGHQIGTGGIAMLRLDEGGDLLAWDEEGAKEVKMTVYKDADLLAEMGEEPQLLSKDEFLLLKTEVLDADAKDNIAAGDAETAPEEAAAASLYSSTPRSLAHRPHPEPQWQDLPPYTIS